MQRFYKGCLSALLLASSLPALAGNYLDRPEAKAMIAELGKEGLDEQRVRTVLGSAKRQDKILEAIARPAEKTLTWAEYQKIFLQDSRVQQGVAFARQHREALDQAEQRYGVPRQVILAIIGVETRYGRHMGNYRVVDALATLGFDYPPRGAFFRKQLKALFELEQNAHIDANTITGSYAGAMGFGQFIPTSYQHFAVDFNNDQVTDLVNDPADAIGSVANYFSEHGWQAGLPVAARARISDNRYRTLLNNNLKPAQTLGKAARAGVTPVSCQAALTSEYCFDLPDSTPVALLELEGTEGAEFWLTTRNFYVITRYNHSPLYAMAVLQLSHRLAAALKESA
ncbi:MAG: lytic murein transglycosylase B [Alcanivorax sp.]|nr:lytic murein transglycosylase B [Alcanivorax sp.]